MEVIIGASNNLGTSPCASQVALVVKNLSANAGDIRDMGLILELGKSPGGEHGNQLQYSCLEKFMDRGAWWATVHRVAKSRIRLSDYHFHYLMDLLFTQYCTGHHVRKKQGWIFDLLL